MAPIKIKYVVSFSSQDKCHKVTNLLEDGSKRWLSDPQDRTGQVEAIFQLERPCSFAFIDIGVIWCSSIEVHVGKSDWPAGQKYTTLVPTQVVMNPMDSRLGRGTNRTCMFSKTVFSPEGRDGLWDRLQIICRQPWRKDVQLGLSFLRVRSSDGGNAATSPALEKVGGDENERKVKSVKDIQQHFFGKDLNSSEKDKDSTLKARLQKLAASAEGGSENPQALPRIAQMVLAANQQSPPTAPQNREDEGRCLYSSSVAQQNAPELEKEISDFLTTLDIKVDDLDSVCVSDLRHKFEKRKWRKLSADEKRVFFTCCQEFIGDLVDNNSSSTPHKTKSAPERTDSKLENMKSPSSAKLSNLSKISPSAKSVNKLPVNGDTPRKVPSAPGTKNSPINSSSTGAVSQSPKTPRPLSQLPNGVGKSLVNGTVPRKRIPDAKGLKPVISNGCDSAKKSSKNEYGEGKGNSSGPASIKSISKISGLSPVLAQKAAMSKLNKTTADPLNKSSVSQSPNSTAVTTSHSLNGHTPSKSTVNMFASGKPSPSSSDTLHTVRGLCSPSQTALKNYSPSSQDSSSATPSRKRSKSKVKTPAFLPNSPGTSGFDSCLKTSLDSPDFSAPSKKQKVDQVKSSSFETSNHHQAVPSAQPDDDEILQGIVAQAISTVDGWLNSRRGPRGGRGVRGKRGGRCRKSTASQGLPLPPDNDDELPDLSFGDGEFPDLAVGTGKRGGRKRGFGQKRGTGTRGRGRQAASALQPSPPSSYTPPGSSFDLNNSGSFLRPAFSNSSDHFDELTIDEDAVFVECPLCMQMFPSDTVNLHASFCCT